MLLYYLSALFKGIHPRVDDDFVDKLNYHYTTSIVFAFAIIVSAKQYVGYPIQCWVPAQFTDPWEQYTENYCWVKNTYFLPLHDPIPPEYSHREIRQIGYYQWVPFVLAIEALMFYIPCILWRGLLQWHAGMDVQGLAQMACDARMLDSDTRAHAVSMIAGHLQDSLDVQRKVRRQRILSALFFCFGGTKANNYVNSVYICIKGLYICNAIGQLVILNAFLGTRNVFYGFVILKDLIVGNEWKESGWFPRVTMCDFDVRQLGNVHHHTVQCVLMINMFNEKIFLFLWFWFFFIAIISALSTIHWIILSVFRRNRLAFIKRYLNASDVVYQDRQSIMKFAYKFLGVDGTFCIRMVSAHAGDIMATELCVELWNRFNNKSRISPQDYGGPPLTLHHDGHNNMSNWMSKGRGSEASMHRQKSSGKHRGKREGSDYSFV